MRKCLLTLLIVAAPALAQVSVYPPSGGPGAGTPGAPGANGATIDSGSGAPTTIGNNGDYYLDNTAHVFYGPKASNAWPYTGFSVIGPAGTGTPGTNGATIQSGTGAPTTIGNVGDYYVDLAAYVFYGPKASGGWPATGFSMVGPAAPVAQQYCTAESTNGKFHPQCYTATGSGNTLVSQADAAFNAAVAYANANGQGALVDLGAAQWNVCNNQQGWVFPQATGATGNGVDISGISKTASVIALTCPIARTALPAGSASGSPISQALLWSPVPTTPHLTSYHWHDFAAYALGNATAVLDMQGDIYLSTFEHISASGAKGDGTASSYSVRFGNSSYPSQAQTFQTNFLDIVITAGTTQGSGFTGTVSGGSGSLAVAVNGGGTNFSANTLVYLTGDQASGNGGPCASAAVLTPNISAGAIQSVAVSTQGYGCTAPIYVAAYDPGYPVARGIWFDRVTDSSTYHLQPTVGTAAGMYSNGANNKYSDTHVCCSLPVGIVEIGTNDWDKTEFDSDGLYAMQFFGGGRSNVTNSLFIWNGSFPGANGYFFASGVGAGRISNDTCYNAQTAGGYQQITSANGIGSPATGWALTNNQECSGLTNRSYTAGLLDVASLTLNSSAAIASAGTLATAPVGFVHLTGTTAITTIPAMPNVATGQTGCADVVADAGWSTAAGGNIATPAFTAVAKLLYRFCYDGTGAAWYIK